MTFLESFNATMAHQRPEKLLFYASFTPDIHSRLVAAIGGADPATYFNYAWNSGVDTRPNAKRPSYDFSRYYPAGSLPEGASISENGVASVPGSLYHFTRMISPLRDATTLSEIEDFPIEDTTEWETSHMGAQVEAIHARGQVAVMWIGHMYEVAWQLRGYEPFLMDLALEPTFAESILDRLMANNLARAKAAAHAGVDYMTTGDDVANQNAMMFSPDTWRRFMKPRWARVFAAAREIKPDIGIWYHSDGNIEAIIPDLIEIGVTILNPVQPECMDPAKVKALYGDRLVLDGAIGTQSVMPWGTPDDVRRTVREFKQALGYDGGFIVSPTHVLEPEVPLANILAFFEACQE